MHAGEGGQLIFGATFLQHPAVDEYEINVARIEELQMEQNRHDLDFIFTKARSTVVSGGAVILMRQKTNGPAERFDSITTEEDLATYKAAVYRFIAL